MVIVSPNDLNLEASLVSGELIVMVSVTVLILLRNGFASESEMVTVCEMALTAPLTLAIASLMVTVWERLLNLEANRVGVELIVTVEVSDKV